MEISSLIKAAAIGITTLLAPILMIGQNIYKGKLAPKLSHVREADVMWMKRVWRRIDLRQKFNHPYYYPERPLDGRQSLFDNLVEAIYKDEIRAFDPGPLGEDDMFQRQFNREKFDNLLLSRDTVSTIDPFTLLDSKTVVETEIKGVDIIMYELKEEWFFDKQRSVMDVRIIGISPVIYYTNAETGDIEGLKNLFWLYFPECRYVFQNFFVYNGGNDAMRMSFDDLFWKRQFSSYIHKESNVFDRNVNPSWDGLDALLESENIKQEMFKIEHDVWHL